MERVHSLSVALLLSLLSSSFNPTWAQISSTFTPPAVPLAVKGPYLNAWMLRRYENLTNWPTYWTTETAVASFTAVIIDNASFGLQGAFFGTPASMKGTTQNGVVYTPTSTIYMMEAGPMLVNATFLSPVTPNDLSQQSLPLSYYFLTFRSTDGASHSVQVYADFTSEWIANGNNTAFVNASSIVDKELVCLQTQLQHPTPLLDVDDFATDSTGIFATSITNNIQSIQWQAGNFTDVRGLGINGSGLQDSIDPTFNLHGQFSPPGVLGMLANLGSISDSSSTPFPIAIGAIRSPSIEVVDLAGEKQLRGPYYMSGSSSVHDLTLSFLQNFTNAQEAAQNFDGKLINDAFNVSESQEYVDLVSIAVRGAMSGMEITLSQNSQGKWDFSDVQAHLKDMGGLQTGPGGTEIISTTTSAVDVLYAASPMYLYLNADLLGYLLKPLLAAQQNSAYSSSISYAAENLGQQFPVAQIQAKSHNFGIEQSANMLIMSLAHAQTTGDGTLITSYYNLLKQWAEYLVQNAMSPNGQTTSQADAITYTNQTNLALKGILGIAAMGKISSFLPNEVDQERYDGLSKTYISQWLNQSVSSDNSQLLLAFGQQNCGGMIYNLYADKLLQLNLVPQDIYQLQTSFHSKQLASSTYGIPLNTCNPGLSRVDWSMFTAATMTDNVVRNNLISQIHSYANTMFNDTTNAPLSTVYNPTNANNSFGSNSPALGAMFSLLALQVPIKSSATTTPSGRHNKGALIGAVLGSIIGVLVLAALCLWAWRRRRTRRRASNLYGNGELHEVVSEVRTPFLRSVFSRRPNAREASPIEDTAAFEATPFRYMASANNSEEDRGVYQSTSQILNHPAPVSVPTSEFSSASYPTTSSGTSANVLDSKVSPPIILRPTTVAESSASSEDVTQPASDGTDVAYWRREAEVLRQELEELSRLPGELPPGYTAA